MPGGLPELVSIPVSGLLSCLGDKQCHWDDGLNQLGLLTLGNHHTDMSVLLPKPGKTRRRMTMSPRG